jgi:signal transduction histidine kinase/CheY-like chemotaxis protein
MAEIILITNDTKHNIDKNKTVQGEYISDLKRVSDFKNTCKENKILENEYSTFLNSVEQNFKKPKKLFLIFTTFLYLAILLIMFFNSPNLASYSVGGVTLFLLIINLLIQLNFRLFHNCLYSSAFSTLVTHLLLAANILVYTVDEETLLSNSSKYVIFKDVSYALYLLYSCINYYLLLNFKNKIGLAHLILEIIVLIYLFIHKGFYMESITLLVFSIFLILFLEKEENIRKSLLAKILINKWELENLGTNKNHIKNDNILGTSKFTLNSEDKEKKLKKLLLAKISHEFKAPIMYIQNILNSLLDKNEESNNNSDYSIEKNFDPDLSTPYRKISNHKFYNYANDINIKSDYLIQLKYLSELVILQILDLCDYANSESSENFNHDFKYLKTMKVYDKSYIEFKTLIDYLVNITKSMLLIFNKGIKVRCLLHHSLIECKTIIDENKLKRLLSNLISNSVKNQYEGEIVIKINPICMGISNSIPPQLHHSQQLQQFVKNYGEGINNIGTNFNPSNFSSESKRLNTATKGYDSEKIILKHNNNLESLEHLGVKSQNKSQKIGLITGFMITIQDSGPGIDEQIISRLNFTNTNLISPDVTCKNSPKIKLKNNLNELDEINLDSNQKDYETTKGCGLGLHLCKKISRELKAEIKCESTQLGTTFKLSFENAVIEKISNENRSDFNETSTILCDQSNNNIIISSAKNLLKYETNSSCISDELELNEINEQLINSGNNNKKFTIVHAERLQLLGKQIYLLNNINFFRNNNKYLTVNKTNSFRTESHFGTGKETHFQTYLSNIHSNQINASTCSNLGNSSGLINLSENFEKTNFSNKRIKTSLFNDNRENPLNKLCSSKILLKNSGKAADRPNSLSKAIAGPGNIRAAKRISKTTIQKKNINFQKFGTAIKNGNSETNKNIPPKKDNQKYIINLIQPEDEETNKTFLDTNLNNVKQTIFSNDEYDSDCSSSSERNTYAQQLNQFINIYPSKPEVSKSMASINSFVDSQLTHLRYLNSPTENCVKILIVDDNINNQDAIERLVQRYFKIHNKKYFSMTNKNKSTTATIQPVIKKLNDGIELVSEIYSEITLNKGKPLSKIIFCDEMMNYMNGSEAFTILCKLFEEKKICKIPFVICSAFSQEAHFEKMKAAKIEHVYQKPLSFGNVEYILDNFIEK